VKNRHRTRAIAAAVVSLAITLALASSCAGQKGRNDDDPGPHDYSIRIEASVQL
jgi:hypothetical protein